MTAVEPQQPVASLRKNLKHFFFVLRNLSFAFDFLNIVFRVRNFDIGADVVVAQ
jgi:hypothetical protein